MHKDLPDDLIETQADLDKTEVVQAYVHGQEHAHA